MRNVLENGIYTVRNSAGLDVAIFGMILGTTLLPAPWIYASAALIFGGPPIVCIEFERSVYAQSGGSGWPCVRAP